MADVFLSYKRDERAAVETIASHLRGLGLTVWFDASLSAGETFNAEIDREARAAKAILVCWSPAARQSEWVNAEAMIGFEQKKLAACYVAGPDGFSAPTPFNASHVEDLRSWMVRPNETHPSWRSVLRRIGKLCGRSDIEAWSALGANATAAELRAWIAAHEASPLRIEVIARLRTRDDEIAERQRLQREARQRWAGEATEGAARVQHEIETALEGFWAVAIVVASAFAVALLLFLTERPWAQRVREPIRPATASPDGATRTAESNPIETSGAHGSLATPAPMQMDCSVFSGMTAERLSERFGDANIRTERLYAGEGRYYEPTVVFPDDPPRRLIITWNSRTGLVDTVEVQGLDSLWVGPRGLRLGQSVSEVEEANGGPFQIYGWYWDGGGRIAGWNRGALTRETCAVFGGFRWPGDLPGLPEGSEAFPSNSAPMRAANPRLEQIRLDLSYRAEYPGSGF